MDLSSWQTVASTVVGLALATLVGVGFRLLAMYTIQQRRERENRQINERLRTLIAAYKTLGGSFTGDLTVDPTHLRDASRHGARRATDAPGVAPGESVAADARAAAGVPALAPIPPTGSDRSRRIRDAVEAALSDIILLGTEEHVRLAERAARELVAGRPVHTAELVVALRAFIRKALGLDPVPADLQIPMQGPLRPAGAAGAGGRGRGEGGRDEGRQGGGGGMGGALGAGLGGGLGGGVGTSLRPDDVDAGHDGETQPAR